MPDARPRATYRLQFRSGVGFDEAAGLAPYLARLGVSHLYASPIFRARTGSTHGYDLVDPNELDPALGGREGFERMVGALHEHGLGLILDIVPNHMGIGPENPWWHDVLTWGRAGPHAAFFDIDWLARAGATPGKVLVPTLGAPYGEALAAGDLRIVLDADAGSFAVAYFDSRFPLNPVTCVELVRGILSDPLVVAFETATPETFPPVAQELRSVLAAEPDLVGRLEAAASALDRERLDRLLEQQSYRLAHWRAGPEMGNYRRFFDIDQLIGVRVEDPDVFEATHRLILELVAEGKVDGLRVDHVDGLADPKGYLERLRRRTAEVADGRPCYLLVEKILGEHEALPEDWPIDGTTGYEFLNVLTGVQIDLAGRKALDAAWAATGGEPDFGAVVREAKQLVLDRSLLAELRRTLSHLHEMATADPIGRDLGPRTLHRSFCELLAGFDVYRTYGTDAPWSEGDRARLEHALSTAEAGSSLEDGAAFRFLRSLLLDRGPGDAALEPLVRLMQQLSGPVMAKSLEDTAFYRWHRLVALSEVGGEPQVFGRSVADLHAANTARAERWPLSMLASATHDTKRGEDTRARIAVLSELAQSWSAEVEAWTALNRPLLEQGPAGPILDGPTQYLFYQALVGVWPLDPAAVEDTGLAALADRVAAYLQKAVREAKRHTSWTRPNEAYEGALDAFVRGALDPRRSEAFLDRLAGFVAGVEVPGAVNGLAQTLIKLTSPGVPDIYQGTERWDQSLVDPDNRRPVDFAARAAALGEEGDWGELLAAWRDGRIKQRLVARVLALRQTLPGLFAEGGYEPLEVTGSEARRVVAFARRLDGRAVVTIAPRLVTPLLEGCSMPLPPPERWAGTRVALPPDAGSWRDWLTDRPVSPTVALAGLLDELPVALLVSGEA